MSDKKVNRYITLFVLAIGAVAIYLLPYLRWTYYDTLMEAVRLTNTQFAATMSVYGAFAMIFYAPGGYIADKLSLKKILTFAFLATGLLGIWYSTFPGYMAQMVIFALWGIISTAFFWSAMMKVTRSLGSGSEQGRMFGFLEGGRGVLSTVVSFISLYFYGKLGESVAGISGIIVAYSILCIVAAVLAWIVIPNKIEGNSENIRFKDVGKILKIPAVWIIAIIVLSAYCVNIGGTYLTPYMTEVLGLTATLAGALGIIRQYVMQAVMGPTSGLIADKIGSVTTVLSACFIIIGFTMVGYIAVPANSSMVIVAVILMLVFCSAMNAMRGIYFAPMDECKIPKELTGTAVGVISVIGFAPDVFMNTIAGALLDKFPGTVGYRYLFIVMLACAVIGLVASIILSKKIKNQKKADAATAESM